MKKSQKQEKNAFIEAHTATKRAWVMVLFIFFMLFLVGSVSAVEWNDILIYSDNDLKVSLDNWWGLGKTIGIAELKSHSSVNEIREVGIGNDVITMWYDFNFAELYTDGLGEVEFRNMKNNNLIKKDYHFVIYKTTKKERDIISRECGISNNGTEFCNDIITGKEIYEDGVWENLNGNDIPQGNVRIGIAVKTLPNEKLDGVWTIAGKKITRHALWDAVLWENFEASGSSTGLITWGVNWNGMAFRVGNNGTNEDFNMTEIGLKMFRFGSPGTITMHFRAAGEDGLPTGSDLVSNNSLDGNSLTTSTSGEWYNFTFGGGLIINASTTYAVMSSNPGGGDANSVRMNYLAPNSYGGWGNRVASSDGGSSFTNVSSHGVAFRIYGLSLGVISFNLTSPENGTSFNTNSLNFSVNVSDESSIGITNVSFIFNGSIQETNTSGIDGIYNFTKNSIPDGNHNWSIEAYDGSDTKHESDVFFFTIDTVFPELNITLPLNTTYTDNYSISPTINISLNWTVSDTNLDSCWYYNTTENVSVTCGNNATIILPYGGYTFIVYANDSVGHESSSNVTATWGYKLLQNSITFNEEAFELSNEEFKINVSSTGEQTVASNLVYNGTSYSSNKAGDNILMEFSRTIPLHTTGNNSFYWSFSYGSEIINSSTYFQNVSETNLANCTSGTKYFNLLLKDEKTMEFLNSSDNISIETVFLYYINDISVNKTFVNSFNQNTVSFCLDPPIENVKVFGEISYDDDLHVKERHFILFENFTNSTTTNISLYDIAASESTSFLVFTETEGAPYPNVYMKLKRQYLNLNDFVVVEMAKADSFGQTVLHFVTEDEIYKIEFYDEEGNLVLTTQPFQAVCIDNVCSMSFKVDPEGGIIPPFQGISPDGNLVFTLSLVGNDTAVLLNYVSTNGSAYNLQMKTAGFSIVNDTVLVCTETQTNTISGSMSCNISSYPFTTYVTELWVDDVLNDIQYSSVTNDAWKDFGNEGIIYTILIIMALTLLLIYTPELCVLGSIAGVLISAKFGFIPMTYVSGMYLVVAGIIIIFKMRKN